MPKAAARAARVAAAPAALRDSHREEVEERPAAAAAADLARATREAEGEAAAEAAAGTRAAAAGLEAEMRALALRADTAAAAAAPAPGVRRSGAAPWGGGKQAFRLAQAAAHAGEVLRALAHPPRQAGRVGAHGRQALPDLRRYRRRSRRKAGPRVAPAAAAQMVVAE